MSKYKLNQCYNKLNSFIDSEVNYEVLSNLRRRLDGSFYNFEERINRNMTNHSFSVSSHTVVGRIKNIFSDGIIYSIKSNLVKYNDVITDICKLFYIELLDIIQQQGSKEDKIRLIDIKVNNFNQKLLSVSWKAKYEEFEMYDEINRYFSWNFGNENFCYEMIDFSRYEHRKFCDYFVELMSDLINTVGRVVDNDIKSLVIPAIEKEENMKKEKNLDNNIQVRDDEIEKEYDNIFFGEQIWEFARSIFDYVDDDVDLNVICEDLNTKLYNDWIEQKNKISEISNEVVSSITLMYQMKKENRMVESKNLLDDYLMFMEFFKEKDYENNEFLNIMEIIIRNAFLSQNDIIYLNEVANNYKKTYNSFISSQIDLIYKDVLEKVYKRFGIMYSNEESETIAESKSHKR